MKRITIQLSQLHQLRINLIQNKRLIQGLFKYTMVYQYTTVCTTSKIITKKEKAWYFKQNLCRNNIISYTVYVEIILFRHRFEMDMSSSTWTCPFNP